MKAAGEEGQLGRKPAADDSEKKRFLPLPFLGDSSYNESVRERRTQNTRARPA